MMADADDDDDDALIHENNVRIALNFYVIIVLSMHSVCYFMYTIF